MTTKTNITLPPLPGALVDVETEARAYARAAVEADRQGRMPSDEELLKVCESAGFLFHYDRYVPGSGYGLQAKAYTLENFRALLSRYSSDRPAEVRCNHCGWLGADVDLVRDVAADEPEDGAADVCPQCKRIGDLQDIGQPAASAEPNTHTDDDAVDRFAAAMKDKLAQARAKGRHGWQECDPSDLSAMLRAHVEKGDPRDVANFCCFLWSLGKPISTAPVAQEPVAEVLSSRKGNDTSTIDKALPAGTKIYVVASDCSRATQDDESLADTQRAIIEAAERRGYERAIAECAQVARAAKGADHG